MLIVMLGAWLLAAPAIEPDRSALEARAVASVDAAYDSARGGWVDKLGVPSEDAIELGLWRAREGDALARERALATLEFVHTLRDTVGGGYVLSSRDLGVERARLDKPARAQSQRLDAVLAALEVTGDARWRDEAAFVADFIDRVLLDGRGGFNSDQIAGVSIAPASSARTTAAWLRWAAASGDPRARDFARRTLDGMTAARFEPVIGIVEWNSFGEPVSVPRLADQIETARALLVSSRVTGRAADLKLAIALADLSLAHYEEPGKGLRSTWSPSGKGARRPPIRARENVRAARLFAELASVTGERRFADACGRLARAFAKGIGKGALDDAEWALALRSLRGTWLAEAPKGWNASGPETERVRKVTRRGR